MAPSTPSLSLSPSHPTLIRTRPDGKSPYKPRAPHVRSSGGTTQLYRPPSAAPPASAADNFPQVGVTRAPTAPASAQQLLETPRQPFIAAEFESRSPWGLGRYDATLAVAHSRRPRRLHPTEAARPLQPWGFGSGMPRLLHPNRDAPDLLADVTPGPHDYVSFAQLQSFTTDARGGNHRAYGKRVEPAPQSERQRPRRKSSVAREHGARYPRGFGNSMPRLLHPNPDAPHVEHQSHSTPVRAPRNSASTIHWRAALRRASHAPAGPVRLRRLRQAAVVRLDQGRQQVLRQTGLLRRPAALAECRPPAVDVGEPRVARVDLSLRRRLIVCE